MKSAPILAALSLLALSVHAQRKDGSGPEAAREQLKQLKVADGLEVTLFASEPMIRNPANMDVDARGRVWATEGANYRVWNEWGKLRPEGDRIVIFEDTDGDGQADKEKTFYQGNDVNTALGICVLGNKVIVSCSPNVLVFTDENGDDVSDKKEVLFTGVKGVDHDHGVHAFVFGPDGKLYFNAGNEGRELHRPDGALVKDRFGFEVKSDAKPYQEGMVFRCNIDGSDLEVLGYNFRNNYEVAVDSFGTLWQSDNDDDGNKGVRINYVMDYGNFGYRDEITRAAWNAKRTHMEAEIPKRHWHLNDPGVVPNLLQTGAGSPTGMLFYEGDLLKDFRGSMIHCDAGPRVVRAYTAKPDGAGYKAEIKDIITSEDTWFRPSDVCAGPDGALYVADWNDAGVGGHQMADQKLETMTGRIYRIAPKGHRSVAPKPDFTSAEGAAKALPSPNLATRYLAFQVLARMNGKAESALQKLWKSENPAVRARAWQLLVRSKGNERKYLDQAIKDKNPDIRNLALRYVRVENKDPIQVVKRLVKDANPQVRRECALSLHMNQSAEAPELWAELAQQYKGEDRWYLEALGIGAFGQDDRFFDAWLKKVGDNWNTPAGRDIVWRTRSAKVPAMIVKIIQDKNSDKDERDRFFRALDFLKGPEKDAALLQLLSQ
ncbi:MAG TPA: PVC-type heme-binding CxxCH protein [Verrucomicrobiae bacterium]|nr:PVC-type heme-binding CxxCH protein [Verrucomicrobiae bacterium]